MHPQTLRIYEQKGLVRPKRTAGNTRLYSDADVERLRLIQRLTTEIGLNLAGVERVLHLEDELQRMRRRLDRMEREMREAIDQVHRSYRRDLVLWTPAHAVPDAEDARWTSRSHVRARTSPAAQEQRVTAASQVYPAHQLLAPLDTRTVRRKAAPARPTAHLQPSVQARNLHLAKK